MSETLEIVISAIDNAGATIRGLTDQIQGLSKVGSSISSVGKKFSVGVTAPIVGGLTLAAKAAIDFESAMADVNKTASLEKGSKEADAMAASILNLSKELPIAASGLAEIAAAGGQMGVKNGELENFVRTVSTMSVAFDMSAGQAGTAISKMMSLYGVGLDGAVEMGDSINQLSNTSRASAAEIVNVMTRVGGIASGFGLVKEEAAALSAAFIVAGGTSETAGTAINGILQTLQTASSEGEKFQRGLESIGLTGEEMEQQIRESPIAAIQMLLNKMNELDPTKRAAAIKDMFGKGGDTALLAKLVGDPAILDKALASATDLEVKTGSMQREYESRAATTANQLQQLRNHVTALGITVGTSLLPHINSLAKAMIPMVEKTAAWVSANPDLTQTLIQVAGALAIIGPILVAVGSAFSAIASIVGTITAVFSAIAGAIAFLGPLFSTLGTVIGLVMGVIAAALGLPVWAVAALVAAFVGAAALIIMNWQRVKSGIVTGVVAIARAMHRPGAAARQMASAIMAGGQQAVASIRNMASQIVALVTGLGARMFSAGAQAMARLAAGIASGSGPVGAAISGIVGLIANKLPGSPVKDGPLKHTLNPSQNSGYKISSMLAGGMSRGQSLVNSATQGLVSPVAESFPSPSSGGGAAFSPSVSITVNSSGGDGDSIGAEVERRMSEVFARLYAEHQANQSRVSYG